MANMANQEEKLRRAALDALTTSKSSAQKMLESLIHGSRISAPLKAHIPQRVTISTPAELGELVKATRKSKKLTQQQLADLSGVGRRFIVECEAGKPRLEFAKVLQVAASSGIDIFAVKR